MQEVGTSADTFPKPINTYCDGISQICNKICYLFEVINYKVNLINATYLPYLLTTSSGKIDLTHQIPYKQWLLSRIILFIRIVKFDGIY